MFAFKARKKAISASIQETRALTVEALVELGQVQRVEAEAIAIASRLSNTRQENHYAERIQAAYQLEKKR